ncbi:mannose-1-phosphate guanylyltransferase [Metabacillus sp. 84]|uniref:mannose-1-phosphate guanylyltransferase n=1 Tax=Metabacillus sp. 84 TaxID=3404705 RepID=UPI003CEDBE87
MKVVIMAGGKGTRFWPWSTKKRPKQFLPLVTEETMLQQTYSRFQKWLAPEKIFIVTSEEFVPLVKEQIRFMHDEQIIIEPEQRDTGPCMALTALKFLEEEDDEVFAAVPSDHFIPEDAQLFEIFELGEEIAEADHSIVTIGITPTRPETGYGYIQAKSEGPKNNVLPVEAFIEKPDKKKAQSLISKENVYWNGGVFIWKPSTIAFYMEKLQPELWKMATESQKITRDQYSLFPKISVDYAILEKAETIYTIPVNMLWDDIGSWGAWDRLHKKSGDDNLLIGNISISESKNCIIKSEDRKTVVIGVEDLIIASTPHGLLICHKSYEKDLKGILQEISNREA